MAPVCLAALALWPAAAGAGAETGQTSSSAIHRGPATKPAPSPPRSAANPARSPTVQGTSVQRGLIRRGGGPDRNENRQGTPGSVLGPTRNGWGDVYSFRRPSRGGQDLRNPAAFSRPLGAGGPPAGVRAGAALDEAETLRADGDYAGASAKAEQARELLDGTPAGDRLALARCLALQGELAWLRGDFANAELLLLRAQAVTEEGVVTGHRDVAALLNQLGVVYQARGLYGRAEPLHRRALEIQEGMLGRDHVEVAASLNNLAILYKAQGLYDRAEPLHQRALLIRQAALGSGHPDVAFSLINLAAVYRAQGRLAQAEPLVQRALRIQEGALGPKHPDVALSLVNLAALHDAQGRAAQAEPLAQRALRIQEAALGDQHPLYAATLSELATLARERGDLPRAESLAQEALGIRETALGQYHPDVAASLAELGAVRVAQGRLDQALPLLTRALGLSESRLRREALDFSESRLADFLDSLRVEVDWLCALARAHPEDPGAVRLALTAALLWKGRSVEETANTSRVVYRSLDGTDRAAFANLRVLRSRLAGLSLDGPGALSHDDYQAQVKALMEQGDAMEADLAHRSARLRAVLALPPPEEISGRVAAALPRDGALVELVAYADRPVASPPQAPAELRYLALVLLPDARVQVVDLGPAAPIDAAASDLRGALASRDADYLSAARALHALVFQRVRPLLGAVRNVFISPDGQLALVPFAVLHDGRAFVGAGYRFTYLTSGKDLLPRPLEAIPRTSVVVFADPDFDAAPGTAVASADDGAMAGLQRSYSVRTVERGWRLGNAGRGWIPLPGTRREAEALRRLFPGAEVFLGPDATKDRLLHLTAPGVLHLATHGFFLEDAEGRAGTRGVGDTGSASLQVANRDPLLRSGLVLAGARSAGGEGTSPSPERTLVTALELAGLDLWGTQLVVLSACDTGRGDVKLGQGVYGLRRALVVAGAETVVMSLWKVDDETTRALMEAYYRNLLAGHGRSTALDEAMQSLRQRRPHPHDWAPFISLGRDAPLRRAEAR